MSTKEDLRDIKFRKRLRIARECADLSRESMAARMGVSSSTILNWEEGKTEITISKLKKWCEITESDLFWIMYGDGFGVVISKMLDATNQSYRLLENAVVDEIVGMSKLAEILHVTENTAKRIHADWIARKAKYSSLEG